MIRPLRLLFVLILTCLLTIVSQTGGVILLVSLFTFKPIDKRLNGRWTRLAAKTFSFATIYLMFTFLFVPLIARPFGRVPMPVFEKRSLQPANIWTCLLNRHYVRPTLRDITYRVAENMNEKYPGTVVNYLDANFPFIDKFPLLPHRSHNDGKKLDLSFQYNDSETGTIETNVPSFIGYGICEEPRAGEQNMPDYCEGRGFSQYNLLRDIVPQGNKSDFRFDSQRTKDLVNSFTSYEGVGKIFIEPHLKERLGLTSHKIRFHGCQAVRHDDHIHVQLK